MILYYKMVKIMACHQFMKSLNENNELFLILKLTLKNQKISNNCRKNLIDHYKIYIKSNGRELYLWKWSYIILILKRLGMVQKKLFENVVKIMQNTYLSKQKNETLSKAFLVII